MPSASAAARTFSSSGFVSVTEWRGKVVGMGAVTPRFRREPPRGFQRACSSAAHVSGRARLLARRLRAAVFRFCRGGRGGPGPTRLAAAARGAAGRPVAVPAGLTRPPEARSTRPPRQPSLVHKAKEQIIRAGNPDLLPALEIPRSTAVSWIRRRLGEVVSLDPDGCEPALRNRVAKLEGRVAMLTAVPNSSIRSGFAS